MKRIRMLLCLCIVLIALFVFAFPSLATEETESSEPSLEESTPPTSNDPVNTYLYPIGDLKLTVYVPSNYTTITRDTPRGAQEFVDLDLYEYDVLLQTMDLNNQYLYAQDLNTLVEISLYAWSIQDSDSIKDFRECMGFELKKIAKDSMENFNTQGNMSYTEYDIRKLDHITYLTFLGTYNEPESGSVQHSFLVVSYVAGNEIQFEMLSNSAFTAEQIADMHKILENTVTPEYASNRLLKETLRYIALGALAIALVVVILIFISSQSKVKKLEREALKRAQEFEVMQESKPEEESAVQPKQEIKMAYETELDDEPQEVSEPTEQLSSSEPTADSTDFDV